VTSIFSSSPVNIQRSNSFSSDTPDTLNEDPSDTQTTVECLSNSEPSKSTMVVVTSPSFNSDLSSEQNDSIDPSSLSFLQTNQRRIDHRRNKSEPFKSASTEDLPSITNNDSLLSNNARDDIRRKSSTKIKQIIPEKSSLSSTTSRKKKLWYNVSLIYCLVFIVQFIYDYLYIIYILPIFVFFFNASMTQSLCEIVITFLFLLKYTKRIENELNDG
jgi:hypothetical protein